MKINTKLEISENTQLFEFVARGQNYEITTLLNKCINTAKNNQCTEILISSISPHYDLVKEQNSWNIKVIGIRNKSN